MTFFPPSAADMPTREAVAPLLGGDLFQSGRYFFHETLDSTNRELARLADAGAEEGTVVVADHQTGGRGRLGRVWASPKGVNLYFSVLLRPDIEARHAAQLTLLAGLALADGVAAQLRAEGGGLEAELEIKWPNDLLLSGRKLAGVLTEMRTENNRVRHVVVGMGVNVNSRPDDFPAELRGQAVSLSQPLRKSLKRSSLLVGLLAAIEGRYRLFLTDGFAPVRSAWLRHSRVLGSRVRVSLAAESYQGRAVAMDADGFLLVERDGGGLVRVLAGDVNLIRGPTSG